MDWQFVGAVVRLLIFLPVVLALAYLATRYIAVSRWRWQRFGGSYLQVVEHVSLGPRCGLFVVRLGGKYCLFTMSERDLKLVRELDDYPAPVTDAAGSRQGLPPWGQELEAIWRRVKRGGEGHAP